MSTKILTNIEGKIRNLPNFYSEALLPVFEAVVNSIQSIESVSGKTNGEITIEVIRNESHVQESLPFPGAVAEKDILGFKITDNGVGFNQENYDSFMTADSIYKQALGCKGIGRFSWLKAFNSVNIESTYRENDKIYKRKIDFTAKELKEIENIEQTSDVEFKTIVELKDFVKKYREKPSAYKTTEKIAGRILEHTLVYFILKTNIQITVKDNDNTFSLNDMFSKVNTSLKEKEISIVENKFQLYHLKIPSTNQKVNNIVYCANGRDVETVNIGKKIGLSSALKEDSGDKFTYTVYVCGTYLDQNVDSSRLEFEIPKGQPETDMPITMNDIEGAVVADIKEELKDYLAKINKQKTERLSNYVATIDPSLRSVVKYANSSILDEIDPEDKEEKFLEILYKHKARIDYDLKKRSQELLKTQYASVGEIRDDYKNTTEELEDYQKDSLAGYIVWRKLIISLFEKKLLASNEGKYVKEDILHDIIFPRKNTSDEIDYNDHNLWLLDERLTFHEYAGSEKALSKQSTSDSDIRPDIIALHECDKDTYQTRSVSLIELKRPQREDIPDEDITKALKIYADTVRNESFKLENGRSIHINENANFYSFLVCDITKKVEQYARFNGFTKLPSEFGYYSYNNEMKLHMYIVGFDKILVDVKKRHAAFFNHLKVNL